MRNVRNASKRYAYALKWCNTPVICCPGPWGLGIAGLLTFSLQSLAKGPALLGQISIKIPGKSLCPPGFDKKKKKKKKKKKQQKNKKNNKKTSKPDPFRQVFLHMAKTQYSNLLSIWL